MKVSDLIKQLSEYDGDREVYCTRCAGVQLDPIVGLDEYEGKLYVYEGS